MSKKIQEFMDKITEDFANENFYPICGTAYGIHVMLFLIGFAFKKNFLILEHLSMLAGFISIMLLCPKLDEGKQKVSFAFLRTFPIFMISALVSTPILKASKKIVEMGGTGKLSILAFMAVFLTIACFVAFYFSDKGKEIVELAKESLKSGAVAAGGIMSLIKSLPLIVRTFRQAVKGFGAKAGVSNRTTQDLPMNFVFIGIGVLAIFMWLCPVIPVNLLGAVIIIIFGFFFATVSSRMVGLVGSSNNPVSGMAIATLLISTMVLKATGMIGMTGMVAAISIGSIICIIAAIAGDTSQDLKTGFLVGSTPKNQQIGELIGVVASAITIGGVLYLLNAAWSYGTEQLPAPQAMLMKMVVEGVMNGNLPWALVFAGVFIAIVVEILGIPVLPFAVGLYLPIHLSTPMIVGGLVRLYFEKKKNETESDRKRKVENGVLYSSGLIAGEGLVGIMLAVFAVIKVDAEKNLGDVFNLSEKINLGNWGGLAFFALLTASLYFVMVKKKK